ncbi:hypothetical protein ACWD6R_04595 [Streptomyces sp. NPDC005151]
MAVAQQGRGVGVRDGLGAVVAGVLLAEAERDVEAVAAARTGLVLVPDDSAVADAREAWGLGGAAAAVATVTSTAVVVAARLRARGLTRGFLSR